MRTLALLLILPLTLAAQEGSELADLLDGDLPERRVQRLDARRPRRPEDHGLALLVHQRDRRPDILYQ